jgi:hypothetical protein
MKTEREAQQFAMPRKIREDVFYTFLDPEQRSTAERMADSLGEAFRGSWVEEKWPFEFWFGPNNQAFLEHLAEFDDAPIKVYKVLEHQLSEYKERTPVIPRWGGGHDEAAVTDKWLNHTRFICQNEYNKTQNEVYAEAVRWVDAEIESRKRHQEWVAERRREAAERRRKAEEGKQRQQAAAPPLPKKVVSYAPPFILATKQDAIFDTLSRSTDQSQHGMLERVLNGETIEERIWVKEQTNSVAHVFLRVLEDANWTQVSHWLAKYFSSGKKVAKPISQATAYDVLRGESDVPKTKQLR